MLQPKFAKFGFLSRLYSQSHLHHFKPTHFTRNHEWINASAANQSGKIIARIGITDYSQKALGDIVFVELPKAGILYHKDGNID